MSPLILLALGWTTRAAPAAADVSADTFDGWRVAYGKVYDDAAVYAERYATWQTNTAFIAARNTEAVQNGESLRLAANRFADLSNDEYREMVLRPRSSTHPRPAAKVTFARLPSANPGPDTWDWVPRGVVTRVKDQGNCGSCWAFSAVAAMEGLYNKMHNGTVPDACSTFFCGPNKTACCEFSEQEIVDCTLAGADTCDLGGEPHDGYLTVGKTLNYLLNTEIQYPYVSGDTGSITPCQPAAGGLGFAVSGYVNVTSGDEEALAQAIVQAPTISVGIDASSMMFQFYSGGVYNNPDCQNTIDKLDHGVTVVGYGFGDPVPPPPPPVPPGPHECYGLHFEKECRSVKGCSWCVTPVDPDGTCVGGPCPNATMVAAAAAVSKIGHNAVSMTQRKPAADLPYWIVKNSWGESWGANGYIFMSKNADNQCGIATDATFPFTSL